MTLRRGAELIKIELRWIDLIECRYLSLSTYSILVWPPSSTGFSSNASP